MNKGEWTEREIRQGISGGSIALPDYGVGARFFFAFGSIITIITGIIAVIGSKYASTILWGIILIIVGIIGGTIGGLLVIIAGIIGLIIAILNPA